MATGEPGKLGLAQKATLGVFTLAIMNVTAVVSLRGLPAEAEYGLTSIFYYLFAAVFFLIPVSIVAAELATAWPQKGGVFRWVGEAFGPRWGFVAIFLLWAESTIWFPTVLTFAWVSLAFIGPQQKWDQALAANNIYTIIAVLVVYWGATFVTLRGLKASSTISKWGGMIGTIIPAAVLILVGIIYLFQGKPLQIQIGWDKLIPDFTNFDNLVLAASIFLFYAGMEMNAIHVKEIDNPSSNYPIVTFLAIMFVILPSVQAAYQILSQLTVTLYLIMYLLMFCAGIYLRHTEPHTARPYKVPGGEAGMWVFAGAGLIGSLIAFVLSFVPPSQISVGSPTTYVLILIAGNLLFVAIPLIIYAVRKPHWKNAEDATDFEPFGWELEGRHPGVVQKQAPAAATVP